MITSQLQSISVSPARRSLCIFRHWANWRPAPSTPEHNQAATAISRQQKSDWHRRGNTTVSATGGLRQAIQQHVHQPRRGYYNRPMIDVSRTVAVCDMGGMQQRADRDDCTPVPRSRVNGISRISSASTTSSSRSDDQLSGNAPPVGFHRFSEQCRCDEAQQDLRHRNNIPIRFRQMSPTTSRCPSSYTNWPATRGLRSSTPRPSRRD